MSDSHLCKHFADENIFFHLWGKSLHLHPTCRGFLLHQDPSLPVTLGVCASVALSLLAVATRENWWVCPGRELGTEPRRSASCYTSEPFWGAQEGKQLLQVSWEQKKKSFWAEGWNRLAGLSGLVPHITNDLIYTYHVSFFILWSISISADPATDRNFLRTSLLYWFQVYLGFKLKLCVSLFFYIGTALSWSLFPTAWTCFVIHTRNTAPVNTVFLQVRYFDS